MKVFVCAVIVGVVGSFSMYGFLSRMDGELRSELQSTVLVDDSISGASVSVTRPVGVESVQGGEDNTVYRLQTAANIEHVPSSKTILVLGADRLAQ